MGGKLTALHRVRAIDGVRHVRKEIAADRKKYLDVSVEHRVQSFDRVIPRFAGWFKVELFPKDVEKSFWRALPHTHRPVTLDIGMSAHAYSACSWTPNMAPNEEKIYDHRNVVDSVALLCNT